MLRYRTALAIFFLHCIVNTKPAVAALVVIGDLLAEKQEIVRQINADPTSLDSISNVGLAESHVIRDLFEGLIKMKRVVRFLVWQIVGQPPVIGFVFFI
ncbi:hypothetical protein [Arsenophonus sp.]|uniref:hypothetical protein n=1 Tax=Arsenophonus sp. TaxID=1872640 RepID=UPI00387A4094